MPLTGQAKREYQRDLMRKRRTLAKAAKIAIEQLTNNAPGRPRTIPSEVMAVAQTVLRDALDRAKVPLDVVIGKAAEKLEASRPYNGYQLVDGTAQSHTLMAQDNDAQLRATELLVDLHERAGTIPCRSNPDRSNGSHVTINLIKFTGTQSAHSDPRALAGGASADTIVLTKEDVRAHDE